jgi:hypothetical protein
MKAEIRQEIAREISRQANQYGSLMQKVMKTNRKKAMFYHDCCNLLYDKAKSIGLKDVDFKKI